MMRRLLVLVLLCATVVMPGRANAGAVECDLQGRAGEFVVRKIKIPYPTQIRFHINRTWGNQLKVGDEQNYHVFVGFWLRRASDFSGMAEAFFDYTTNLSPGGVAVHYEGLEPIDEHLPSSNLLVDGDQGIWAYPGTLDVGTYYFIGFGDGGGTFDMDATYSDSYGATCDPMPDVTGEVVGYNALDFKGGTSIVAPGYGYADEAKLSYTTTAPLILGAIFAYQPDPFPPPRLKLQTEWGVEVYYDTMAGLVGNARQWNWTVSYRGKTNTILIETVELSLVPG